LADDAVIRLAGRFESLRAGSWQNRRENNPKSYLNALELRSRFRVMVQLETHDFSSTRKHGPAKLICPLS